MGNNPLVEQMVLLFLLMGVGYIAAKCKVLTRESNRHLTNLVLCITNPCTVLYSVLNAEQSLDTKQLFLLTGIALAYYIFMILFSLALPRLLMVPKENVGIYRYMTVFSNVGFMGFPVVRAVYGDGAVFYAAIFNLFFQFFAFTYGIRQVSGDKNEGNFSIKTLCQPMIVAGLLAYAIYLFKLKEPIRSTVPGELLTQAIGMVGNVSSPVCMLATGVGLAQIPLGKVFTKWRLYFLAVVKQLILPIVVYSVLAPFVTQRLILGICVLMAAMPVGTTATLLSAKYNKPPDEPAAGIFITTLLSVPAVPILMSLLF